MAMAAHGKIATANRALFPCGSPRDHDHLLERRAKPGSKDITEIHLDAVTGEVVAVETETSAAQAKEKTESGRKNHKKSEKSKN